MALGVITGFRDQGNIVRKNQKKNGSQPVFSWLSDGMADTKRTTKNRGLSCQQRNAEHHSNTRLKISARVRFPAERVFRETKKTRSRNLDIRSSSHKAKQQNARKPANHFQGYSTKFGVETGKMNSSARRNRFYAKRRLERTKWDPFLKKMGSSCCFCDQQLAGVS